MVQYVYIFFGQPKNWDWFERTETIGFFGTNQFGEFL